MSRALFLTVMLSCPTSLILRPKLEDKLFKIATFFSWVEMTPLVEASASAKNGVDSLTILTMLSGRLKIHTHITLNAFMLLH